MKSPLRHHLFPPNEHEIILLVQETSCILGVCPACSDPALIGERWAGRKATSPGPGEECGPPKLSETNSSSSTCGFWAPRTPLPSTPLIQLFWSVCSAEITTQHKPPSQGEGEELTSDREASGECSDLFPSPTSSPASACPCVPWRVDL